MPVDSLCGSTWESTHIPGGRVVNTTNRVITYSLVTLDGVGNRVELL